MITNSAQGTTEIQKGVVLGSTGTRVVWRTRVVWTAPASRRRLPRQGSPAGAAPQRYMISGPEAAPVGRDPPPRTTPDCRSGGSRGGGRGRGCLRKDGSRRQHPRKTSGSRRESRPNRGGSRLEAARAAGGTCRGHDGARRRHAAQQPSPAMARVLPRPARSTGSPSQPLRALLPRRSAAAARWRLQCRRRCWAAPSHNSCPARSGRSWIGTKPPSRRSRSWPPRRLRVV